MHTRLVAVLACQVARLDTSYRSLKAAFDVGQVTAVGAGEAQAAQELALRQAIEQYFEAQQDGWLPGVAVDTSTAAQLLLDTAGLPLKRAEPALLQAARAALRRNREQAGPALSGRALARILHGVGSPAFPTADWKKRMGAFWGSQEHVDFAAVFKASEIVVRSDA